MWFGKLKVDILSDLQGPGSVERIIFSSFGLGRRSAWLVNWSKALRWKPSDLGAKMWAHILGWSSKPAANAVALWKIHGFPSFFWWANVGSLNMSYLVWYDPHCGNNENHETWQIQATLPCPHRGPELAVIPYLRKVWTTEFEAWGATLPSLPSLLVLPEIWRLGGCHFREMPAWPNLAVLSQNQKKKLCGAGSYVKTSPMFHDSPSFIIFYPCFTPCFPPVMW